MISEARLRANRRNAARSTGPRTEAGKLRSRCNALKHGLTGRGEVQAEGEASAIERRSAEWAGSLRPSGEHEQWLARQVVQASVRIDRCQELERSRRGMDAARAVACWEDDRHHVAEELGARLARDPGLVAARLRRSRQGCNWLLVRWRKLEAALHERGGWREGQRALALDLLGEPAATRDADLAALATATPEELAAIVGAEVESLESLKAEALDELDAAERALAEAGLPVEEGAEVRRIRRYEAACWRAMRWAQDQLAAAGRRPTAPPPPPDRPADPDPGAPRPAVEADGPPIAGSAPTPTGRPPATPGASAAPGTALAVPTAPVAAPTPAATSRGAVVPMAGADRPPNRQTRRALERRSRVR